jgi:hypothetical protein
MATAKYAKYAQKSGFHRSLAFPAIHRQWPRKLPPRVMRSSTANSILSPTFGAVGQIPMISCPPSSKPRVFEEMSSDPAKRVRLVSELAKY